MFARISKIAFFTAAILPFVTAAVQADQIATAFASSYVINKGDDYAASGVPASYGGMTFEAGNPNVLFGRRPF